MDLNKFTCCICGVDYHKKNSDHSSLKEYEELYGDFAHLDKMEIACGDCYKVYLDWHHSLTQEQRDDIEREVRGRN